MVHHFNKKNIPILNVILEINGLVLVFFLVIAVLSELCWFPYFINSMAPVQRWNSPQIFDNLSSCDQACVNAAN